MIESDLFALLIFTMPGFFFLKSVGYKASSSHEHLIISLATGIVLVAIWAALPASWLKYR